MVSTSLKYRCLAQTFQAPKMIDSPLFNGSNFIPNLNQAQILKEKAMLHIWIMVFGEYIYIAQ